LENCSDVDPLNLADLYYNMGALLLVMTHYDESMLWNEKALKIRLNHLPWTHPAVELSYSIIGQVFCFLAVTKSTCVNQQLLRKALNNMEKADYIFQKTLIPFHRDTLRNQRDIAFIKTLMK
jgi:tetratricopeptide (TPR) repeat protein